MTRAALLLSLLSAPAMAQVRVDPGALDALTQTPPATAPAKRAPPKRPAAPAHPVKPKAPTKPPAPVVSAPAPPAPPKVSAAPPPAPVVPPPIAVPVQRPPPPAAVPVINDAPGEASKVPGGLRVTFGTGRADLNPGTEAALRMFAKTVKPDEGVSLNVYAYAAATEDDPSTPRRLSLSRALAVRAAMISEGIVSTRIYVRALGASAAAVTDKVGDKAGDKAGADAPPDRVDVTRVGAPDAPAP